jgi:hypothetical protein
MTDEQIELELIRLYHCVPSALDNEDARVLNEHLLILSCEAQVASSRAGKKSLSAAAVSKATKAQATQAKPNQRPRTEN